ncbi:hypothetical protein LT679_17500 [Mucilaginibacter roseus]|uniref:Uncharacterized protein n=1 Tax=Mucilaginibacter roseus TaxID=1528868 RepID=A0ABS8U888_9SPHI|nr:hypothetical protein [Mucilaginibacter roseus]MCD8742410.1 hypothetical protein [Mucilaginibacter roseus]
MPLIAIGALFIIVNHPKTIATTLNKGSDARFILIESSSKLLSSFKISAILLVLNSKKYISTQGITTADAMLIKTKTMLSGTPVVNCRIVKKIANVCGSEIKAL